MSKFYSAPSDDWLVAEKERFENAKQTELQQKTAIEWELEAHRNCRAGGREAPTCSECGMILDPIHEAEHHQAHRRLAECNKEIEMIDTEIGQINRQLAQRRE